MHMSAAANPHVDPEQIRELELLRREYDAQMRASSDPQDKRRLYAVKKQLEESIVRAQNSAKMNANAAPDEEL